MGEHVPEELFEEEVYDHFYAPLLEPIAAENAQLIARVAGLAAPADILDAPCGDGRVSVELAKLGHRVTGVDRSPRFIARARERDGAAGIDFRIGDLRDLDFEGSFDLVLNWFSSFGYLEPDENRAVLRAFRRALHPGGSLILEQRNTHLTRRAVEAGGGMTAFIIDKGDDLIGDRITIEEGRSISERFVVRDGRVHRLRFSIELFDRPQLTAALLEAGFAEVTMLNERGESFVDTDARMLALARV
jgi:SAM-dependent methyltransferase